MSNEARNLPVPAVNLVADISDPNLFLNTYKDKTLQQLLDDGDLTLCNKTNVSGAPSTSDLKDQLAESSRGLQILGSLQKGGFRPCLDEAEAASENLAEVMKYLQGPLMEPLLARTLQAKESLDQVRTFLRNHGPAFVLRATEHIETNRSALLSHIFMMEEQAEGRLGDQQPGPRSKKRKLEEPSNEDLNVRSMPKTNDAAPEAPNEKTIPNNDDAAPRMVRDGELGYEDVPIADAQPMGPTPAPAPVQPRTIPRPATLPTQMAGYPPIHAPNSAAAGHHPSTPNHVAARQQPWNVSNPFSAQRPPSTPSQMGIRHQAWNPSNHMGGHHPRSALGQVGAPSPMGSYPSSTAHNPFMDVPQHSSPHDPMMADAAPSMARRVESLQAQPVHKSNSPVAKAKAPGPNDDDQASTTIDMSDYDTVCTDDDSKPPFVTLADYSNHAKAKQTILEIIGKPEWKDTTLTLALLKNHKVGTHENFRKIIKSMANSDTSEVCPFYRAKGRGKSLPMKFDSFRERFTGCPAKEKLLYRLNLLLFICGEKMSYQLSVPTGNKKDESTFLVKFCIDENGNAWDSANPRGH